jgi:glycosyltransferase involved in cell wall biosynthesis
MLNGKKICVVLPAYNAEKTLLQTYNEIPHAIVDSVILVDDASTDRTAALSKSLPIETIVHARNLGYGANQKTCYRKALENGADIVVMLHPDYQYTPLLITAMASMIAYGVYDAVLGSRILGQGALQGGMPLYKYISNRFLTFVQNILVGRKHTEYHTGYRAYGRHVLTAIPFNRNNNGFLFDNQFLVQIIGFGFSLGEVSCPTRYFKEASSIGFFAALAYGTGCLWVSVRYFLHRSGLLPYDIMRK